MPALELDVDDGVTSHSASRDNVKPFGEVNPQYSLVEKKYLLLEFERSSTGPQGEGRSSVWVRNLLRIEVACCRGASWQINS